MLYKERNALLTFTLRMGRSRETQSKVEAAAVKLRKVKDSMRGIKAVLGERRNAFKESSLP